MFKVLSLDGGGIRGVIPAAFMKHLEASTGKPIAEMFDLFVGTSTGGILAAGLTVPGKSGKPKYSAEAMLELYEDHGSTIFERSFWRGVTSVAGAFDEKYDHRPLEKLLKEYFGENTLKDCVKPTVLTSYDIERRQPYFFKSRRAHKSKDRNHYLRDATRATSAAPTYFEPALTPSLAKKPTRRALIDGGVFLNNPGMSALAEAIAMNQVPNDIVMVSIGTGIATRKIEYDDAKDWGALGWVQPVISIMMDGEADAADYQLRQILPDQSHGDQQRYYRFDTELELALDDLDAANQANIAALKAEAQQIVEAQAEELKRLVAVLGD